MVGPAISVATPVFYYSAEAVNTFRSSGNLYTLQYFELNKYIAFTKFRRGITSVKRNPGDI
ncbi:hypothetical protein OUZ56_029340 [Daphnia magna]|uniref:Uncharacterized protein n=1 Tax=Daphnia magna TaxID=35525 RepID=A0ABR0B6K2_9CRUS|nr:hypothetical protein OUZ56_029340 [Daphnia magna]